MELFTTNNSEIIIEKILIYLLLFGVPLSASMLILKHKANRINYFLSISTILFLIFYLPIVEYFSIWTEISFWPQDFYPNFGGGSVLNAPSHPNYNRVFGFLSIISQFLLFFSIFLFIHKIKKIFSITLVNDTFILWIPIINSIIIGYKLVNFFKDKTIYQIAALLWIIFSSLWVYYRFLAAPLSLIGVDSFSIIDQILFGENKQQLTDMQVSGSPQTILSYTIITDLISIITPALTYISGLLTFVIINKIKTSANIGNRCTTP